MPDDILNILGPTAEADQYVTIESDPDEYDVFDGDGGDTIVEWGEAAEERPKDNSEFYANLADGVLPDTVLNSIAEDLLRKIEEDKRARTDRDKQYEEGIRRTGLGKDAPGGAEFDGASKVVHPGLIEACIDAESRLMKELWPPSGPVKQKIIGKPTKEKAERAERQTAWLNHQLTTQIKEARAVTETTLIQCSLAGSQFIKLWQDHRLKRPRMQFFGVDKVILPANAESYNSSTRRTVIDTISSVEMKQRVDQGMYRDLKLEAPGIEPEPTKTQTANQKIEGIQPQGINIDGDREVYEVMSFIEVTSEMADILGYEEEGWLCPYLVSIDLSTRQVLSLYRDWEEADEAREPIEHLFEFPFIQWRGALSLGFIHIIGMLSGTATGAMRALLDSAFIDNTPGGVILKGSGVSGQNKKPQVGDWVEIDTGMESADIREKLMPFPSKGPSAVLFQLLGFAVDAMKGVVRTSLDETTIDSNQNTPVGTQASRVEEGLVVFSNIHGRIHAAFNRLLAGLARLNRMYLVDAVKVDHDGKEIVITRKDFTGSHAVQPVSDPTIYSDMQRWAQIAEMENAALKFQGVYNIRAIQKRKLTLLKVVDPDELLTPEPKPIELNAVNENLAMAFGRPVVAFPEQDHLAHLQVHLDFGKSPIFGQNPIIAPRFLPGFVQHCAEHIVYHYVSLNHQLLTEASGVDASELMSTNPDVKRDFDRLLAKASQIIVPMAEGAFTGGTAGGAIAVLTQALQQLKALQPPGPVDPAAAAVQAAAAETGRKTQDDQTKAKLAQSKQAQDAETSDRKAAIDQQKIEAMKDKTDADNRTKMAISLLDTNTARDIAASEIASGERAKYKDGESISP